MFIKNLKGKSLFNPFTRSIPPMSNRFGYSTHLVK